MDSRMTTIRTATGDLAERLARAHAAWAAAEHALCAALLPEDAETVLFDEQGLVVAMADGSLWQSPAPRREAA
jgi:hypothetical protein